ncbi:DsbA family protein [Halovivax cerinus]|uniref:DsbA family protein n=1 Tax=Halovivax cerinus TaxID=1487865 RepID=A0ABD5NQN9_9EURY|nr:thioredoxin domain-containing protein [Halovivax cerinus]
MALDPKSRRAVVAGGALALGGGGLFFARSRGGSETAVSPSFHASEETTAIGLELTGKPLLGSPDAPIDLYYWTDFQCPFCETFERETLPDLVREHTQSGDVRVVFVPIAVFGEDSMTAAVASRCVWDQVVADDPSVYWDWHGAIFEEQDGKNTGWADAGTLVSYTRSVDGVDADALETCLADDRDRFQSMVEADIQFATELGVTGTPTFLAFNRESEAHQTLIGAQPLEKFSDAIARVRRN